MATHLGTSKHARRFVQWLDQTGNLYSNFGGVTISQVVMPQAILLGERRNSFQDRPR